MDTSLLLALLAATVTLIGWLVNYVLSGRDERRKKQLDTSLSYLESQLQEMYGPLAFLMLERRNTHKDLLTTLGRDEVFEPGKELSEDDLKVWLFWVDNDILPRNDKVKDLLTSKTHLIEGPQVPSSYLDFLDYHNSWKINHLRWQKDNVKYSWRSDRAFPQEFEDEVIQTFEHLKEKHAKMLGERHVAEESLRPLQKS
jgi:hypothetical protein